MKPYQKGMWWQDEIISKRKRMAGWNSIRKGEQRQDKTVLKRVVTTRGNYTKNKNGGRMKPCWEEKGWQDKTIPKRKAVAGRNLIKKESEEKKSIMRCSRANKYNEFPKIKMEKDHLHLKKQKVYTVFPTLGSYARC